MTDVYLFNTSDGGEIEVVGGRFTMSDGIETAVFLSLFGGNERDSGLQAGDRLQWWGNLGEREPARRYRSETQYLLRSLPALPIYLQRLEDAGERDLAWMVETGLATAARVDVSIPALNSVLIKPTIEIDNRTQIFQFPQPWRTAA